jgi:hypothetical protein
MLSKKASSDSEKVMMHFPTKLTWDESVKRDLREWNISKDLALDRGAWRLAINVPEP